MSAYYRLLVHVAIFVGSLWIVKRGFEGSVRRDQQTNLRGMKRPLVSASSLPLSLAYIVFGMVTVILTIVSLFQPDYRVLQLALVVLVLWLMTNIVSNWFVKG
jgi:hypothetical protein